MADDPVNPPTTSNDSTQPPAGGSPADKSGSSSSQDQVKMAEELGRLKKVEEDYKKYLSDVDPVIQTLYSDQELFQKVGDVHRKRMGISPADPEDKPGDKSNISPPSQESKDTRNYLVSQLVKDFYSRNGLDKLDAEKKQEVDQKISMVLKETLNPTGGKSLQQIMEDVPLDALPGHLDKAFFWATREDREKTLKEQAKNEALTGSIGIIGSMTSSSPTSDDDVALTAKEMEICRKAGWDPQKFLANKKEIAKRDNQIY